MARAATLTCGLAMAAAVAVWGYGVERVLTAKPVTLAHQVTWRGPGGGPMQLAGKYDPSPCTHFGDHTMLVLGERVIVTCINGHTGFAAIDPRAGTGEFLWPLPDEMHYPHVVGLAPRADGRFGVVVEAQVGDEHTRLAVGLAGPRGWLVPPTFVGKLDSGYEATEVLAMGWVGDAVEVVVTSPGPGVYGWNTTPTVLRLTAGMPLVRTSHPAPSCECLIVGAIPSAGGWTLIITRWDETSAERGKLDKLVQLVSPTGEVSVAPEALAWWQETIPDGDLAALGVIRDQRGPIVERDGSRHEPAIPGGRSLDGAFKIDSALELVDGVLRRVPAWFDGRHNVTTSVTGRTVVLGVGSFEPETLDSTPFVTEERSPTDFAFVPVGDVVYWVTIDGHYVTLDRALRRIDPRPLSDHLRTRGSAGSFIDEPEHVIWMWLVILGLPVALVLGSIATRVAAARAVEPLAPAIVRGKRRRVTGPITVAGVIYLLVAWKALSDLRTLL